VLTNAANARGGRIAAKDIQCGRRKVPIVEGVEEGNLIHDASACCIDQKGSGLHAGQLGCAKYFRFASDVNRYDVRLGQHLVQRMHASAGGQFLAIGKYHVK